MIMMSSKKEEKKEGRKKVKITVLRRFHPNEVFEKNPLTPTEEPFEKCNLVEDNQVYIVDDYYGGMPKDFGCEAAYHYIRGDVEVLALGGEFGWYKEKGKTIIPCMDGNRPVIFMLERMDEPCEEPKWD